MTELERLYQNMANTLEQGMTDLEKFEEGNMSAGTRVRKNMQTIKDLAQKVRVAVQEQKNAVASLNSYNVNDNHYRYVKQLCLYQFYGP